FRADAGTEAEAGVEADAEADPRFVIDEDVDPRTRFARRARRRGTAARSAHGRARRSFHRRRVRADSGRNAVGARAGPPDSGGAADRRHARRPLRRERYRRRAGRGRRSPLPATRSRRVACRSRSAARGEQALPAPGAPHEAAGRRHRARTIRGRWRATALRSGRELRLSRPRRSRIEAGAQRRRAAALEPGTRSPRRGARTDRLRTQRTRHMKSLRFLATFAIALVTVVAAPASDARSSTNATANPRLKVALVSTKMVLERKFRLLADAARTQDVELAWTRVDVDGAEGVARALDGARFVLIDAPRADDRALVERIAGERLRDAALPGVGIHVMSPPRRLQALRVEN